MIVGVRLQKQEDLLINKLLRRVRGKAYKGGPSIKEVETYFLKKRNVEDIDEYVTTTQMFHRDPEKNIVVKNRSTFLL